MNQNLRHECERCTEPGVGFNEGGDWLCEDCIVDEAIEAAMPDIVAGKWPPETL